MTTNTTPHDRGISLGSAVTYKGLATQVISGPRDTMGIRVVTLAYIGYPVQVSDPELQLMATPRPATPEEQQQHFDNMKNKVL